MKASFVLLCACVIQLTIALPQKRENINFISSFNADISSLLESATAILFGEPESSKEKNKENADEVTYVGAVLEFEPYNEWTDAEMGYGVIRENAETILEYAADAKSQNVDIMITPEYGLQSLDMYDNDTDKFLTFTQFVPDPIDALAPCDMNKDADNFEGMYLLSCGARENEMYLVIDMAELYPCSEDTVPLAPWDVEVSADCPELGYFVYNAQVVFDRDGVVIARYRKQNLFMEDAFTPGSDDDSVAVFLTDFDVLFSLQICFDIVFEHPGYSNVKNTGIRDVAMSTAWVDYLPFDLADSVQNSWSRGLGTNLLVAGYHKPEIYKLGSGIYRGYAQDSPVYTYDKDSGNILVVANVTTISSTSLAAGPTKADSSFHSSVKNNVQGETIFNGFRLSQDEDRTHRMLHENIENYTRTILTNESGDKNVSSCSYDNFCCDLTYEYTGNEIYMFIVLSGQFTVGYGRYPVGIKNCAVVWCKSENHLSCALVEPGLPDSDSFGPFSLTSSSFNIDSIFPGGNHRDLSLISNDELQYEVSGNQYTLTAPAAVDDLLMATLYGRWYSNDGF